MLKSIKKEKPVKLQRDIDEVERNWRRTIKKDTMQ